MRFRLGWMLGFGTGYVLGAKAGRERYDQIRASAITAWRSDQAVRLRRSMQQASESARSMFGGGQEDELAIEREVRLP